MKALLVISVCLLFGSGHAGVRELSPQEEQEALQLFQQICASGSEGTNLGDTLVYCKRARGENTQTLQHQVQVNGNQAAPNQVVFVQPPPVRYLHRVAITGQGGAGQQAKIYVLPQQATHELQAQYQGGAAQAQKPVVYFLKGGEKGGAAGGGGGDGGTGGDGGGSNGGSNNNGGGGYPGGGNTGGGSNGGSNGGGGYQGGGNTGGNNNGGSNGGGGGYNGGSSGGSGGGYVR